MSILATLEQFISDLLPDGFFWRGEAAERFVRALARAWQTPGDFVGDLRDAIYPGTCGYDVLVQWWDFLRGDLACVAIPTDIEDLRERVLALLSAADAGTPAGLRVVIQSYLPYVDVYESLPVSWIPSTVPFDVEPTGRVLEVWYSPLINTEASVRCVVEAFKAAADALRLVSPTLTWGTSGPIASENLIRWTYVDGTARLYVERALLASEPFTENATYVVTARSGTVALDAVFGFDPDEFVQGNKFIFRVERDFADGAGFVPVSSNFEYTLTGTDVEAFTNLTGLAPSHYWPGTKEDSVAGLPESELVPLNAAIDAQNALGLQPSLLTSKMFQLGRADGTAWQFPDPGVLGYAGTTWGWIWVMRSSNPANSLNNVFGKRRNGTPDFRGLEIFFTNAGAGVQARMTDSGASTFDTILNGPYNDGQWHVLAVVADAGAAQWQLFSELGAGSVGSLGGGANPTEIPMSLGTQRLASAGMDIALWAYIPGEQAISLDQAVCADVYQQLVGVGFGANNLVLSTDYDFIITTSGDIVIA